MSLSSVEESDFSPSSRMFAPRKLFKIFGIATLVVAVLIVLLVVAVYLPPVQRWAVGRVSASLEEKMGLKVDIDEVRLTPFLNLNVGNLRATDAEGDTLLLAERLHLDVAFWPLWEGRADIDGVTLNGARVNTKSLLPDVEVKGSVARLEAAAHGVEWAHGHVRLDRALLDGANLNVALSDTAKKDTTETLVQWLIETDELAVRRSEIALTMPGDSLHVRAKMGDAVLKHGVFDLECPRYSIRSFQLKEGAVSMNTTRRPLPHDALFDIAGLAVDVHDLSFDENKRLKLNLAHAAALERQRNLRITELRGAVLMDTLRVSLPDVLLTTTQSRIGASLEADFAALQPNGRGTLRTRIDARIAPSDIRSIARHDAPASMRRQIDELTQTLLENDIVEMGLALTGNLRNLAVERVSLNAPGLVEAKVDGFVRNALSEQRSGHLNYSAATRTTRRVRALLPKSAASSLNVPDAMHLLGAVDFAGADYRTHFALQQGKGNVNGRAAVNLNTERYSAQFDVRQFELAQFLKGQPIGPLTGKLGVEGRGFNADAARANLRATAEVREGRYDRFSLGGIGLSAALHGGHAVVDFKARNPLIDGEGRITAELNRRYAAQMDVRLARVDLRGLGVIEDTLSLGGNFRGTVESSQDFRHMAARGELRNLCFVAPSRLLIAQDVLLDLASRTDSTFAHINSGDLKLNFAAGSGLQGLADRGLKIAKMAMRQLEHRDIDQALLKRELPDATLQLEAGQENLLARYLRYKKYGVNSIALNVTSNATQGLNGFMRIGKLQAEGLVIDTIQATITHGEEGLELAATVENRKTENPNPFLATLHGHLLRAGAAADIAFQDANRRLGLRLGAQVEMEDGGTRLHLNADTAVVAYRNFSVNADNYLFVSNDRRVRANIKLLADDGTGLQIYSEGSDSLKNDITLTINRLNLGELANVLPYLPKVGGTLDGDFHIIEDQHNFAAVGAATAKNFSYEGTQIGTLGTELMYQPGENGQHIANGYLTLDGKEVAEIGGTYDPKGKGNFDGSFNIRSLPLNVANAFLKETGFAMRGTAEGAFSVKGALDAPVINGRLKLDEAHLYSNVYGIDFAVDSVPLELKNSLLELKNYQLTTADKVPLTLRGKVDLTNPASPYVYIDVIGRQFPLVNTKRKNESLLYGKLLTNILANVHGTLDKLVVAGRLTVLEKTDVTYVMTNTPLTSGSNLSDLVTFTDFSDTLTVASSAEETKKSNMDVWMEIIVKKGARFRCYLTPNGDSYVDATGEGNLTFRMPPQGEMRMTGRITIDEGKMNYELPVIPLRTFNFASGSSIDFTGNVMNPTLNITATERVKTIVTEDDRQRAVTFDAGVKISRTVEDMGLEFIIDAPEDLEIKNQLTAMSKEERGKAAVALLATGMYITDDNLATGGLKASNALNAFLQSQIQDIAGKALSTIDLSFGMESGVNAAGETTTDYSYQFSKRFLNDRVRFVIGGKVSSSADATEATQSFIDNIAIEYRLDAANNRYVRLFYDRNSYDALEGTLMKTGAGFVMRRKADRFSDLFLIRRKKKSTTEKSKSK